MKQQIKILSYILFLSNSLFSQIENDSLDKIKIEPKLSVFDSIKKTFVNHSEVSCFDSMWMKELSNNELSVIQFEDILKINPDENVIYDLNTDVLKERLAKLDAKSPFNIEYNVGLENVIKSLLKNRKKSYERLLGISQYYFPLFEEALSKYNIPIEVKYLAIVESALNPKAKSRVGATGLWQFMYNTGLQYKLDVNSYIDERSDPIKATEAACKYLSGMYNIFGDWDLVLASYNCGPGNVTKAIRRSNGQTNYWNIRKNLPKETAGYLPAFLATMYIMEYHNEHGINKPKALVNYFATDTIVVKKQLSFNQISRLIDISEAELQFLNPSYKLNVIPVIENKINYLRLPQEKIAVFTSNEDKIYYFANYEANLREKPNQAPVFVKDSLSFYTSEKKFVTKFKKYKVSKGDNLSEIASKFDVTISDIKKWNGLKNNKAPRGKNLKIKTTENVVVRVRHAIKPENSIANTNKKDLLVKESDPRIDNIALEKTTESIVAGNSESDNNLAENVQEEIAFNNNKTITKEEVQKLEKIAIVDTKPSKEDFIIKYNKVISFKDVIKSYKVKKGDNLSEIADKFNVTASEIKKWNNLKSNAVAKGKNLKIITNEKVVTTTKIKEPKKLEANKQTESSKIA
ncbi:MAG: transglycosylase SLT domain-containing protein, partial [Flavobacterium sp.]|nr:transglycosylase SLT domain-containing protein [Flavobacterium sp.]